MAEPERRTRSTGTRIAVGLGLTFVLASAAAMAVPWLQRPPGPARTTASAQGTAAPLPVLGRQGRPAVRVGFPSPLWSRQCAPSW